PAYCGTRFRATGRNQMDGSIARLRNAVYKPGQSWCCTTFPLVLCATLNGSWTRQPRWASACGRISRRSVCLFSMGASFGRSAIFSRRRARSKCQRIAETLPSGSSSRTSLLEMAQVWERLAHEDASHAYGRRQCDSPSHVASVFQKGFSHSHPALGEMPFLKHRLMSIPILLHVVRGSALLKGFPPPLDCAL